MITSKQTNGLNDIEDVLFVRGAVSGNRDTDDYDEFAMHVVFYDDEKPCAYGRIIYTDRFIIDAVCVIEEFRGEYIGDLLARLLIYKTVRYASEVFLTSRTEDEGFFARFGFKPASETGDGFTLMKVNKQDVVFPSKCGHNHGILEDDK